MSEIMKFTSLDILIALERERERHFDWYLLLFFVVLVPESSDFELTMSKNNLGFQTFLRRRDVPNAWFGWLLEKCL